MTARTPEDLLAAVPLVLGFHPERSLVMLTFSADRSAFHARVDLPDPGDAAAVIDLLRDAATRSRVDRVAFVFYTDDPGEAFALAPPLVAGFAGEGIDVIDVLRCDGRRWFPLASGPEHKGTAYDVSAHPFAAQGVFQGVVTHPTRLALSESLVGPDDARARVEAAVPDALTRVPALQRAAEARWLRDLVHAQVADAASPLPDDEVARLVVALLDVELRDVAWSHMGQANARRHTRLWTDVVRRTPDDFLPPVATLLAFSAWLDGHGALAWCALDRVSKVDPDYPLAHLLSTILENAVPPSSWEPVPLEQHPLLNPASRLRRDGAGPIPGEEGSGGHTTRAG